MAQLAAIATAIPDIRANATARRAIYGPESREDEHSVLVSDYWRGVGTSTVVLVRPLTVRGGVWAACGALRNSYACNGQQRFGDQPSCGFCSGECHGVVGA